GHLSQILFSLIFHRMRCQISSLIIYFPQYSSLWDTYHVLNGGDPGGEFMIRSANGIRYPIETTISINTIHNPQRSVHFGVGASSTSGSPIGNSVFPLGARNMRW